MGWILATSLGIALAVSAVHAVAREPVQAGTSHFPAELRGAWFPDDAEGRAGCAAHRRRPTPRDELDWGRIVGAVMVGAERAHRVSDYGEGNVDWPVAVAATGPGRWRIASRVGIDGEPEPGEPPTVYEIHLANGRLQWRMAGETADVGPTYVLCNRRIPGDGR